MKKLFLLAGLIMVTVASCNLEENLKSNSNEKEKNISFAYVGRTGEGIAEFDICQNYVKDGNLYIETGRSGSHTYPLTDIKEEYAEYAKKHKVSCIVLNGKLEPVILEKTKYTDFKNADSDQRKFTIRGILKDSKIIDAAYYSLFYNELFFLGFTKTATQIMENGDLFFSNGDLDTEISQPIKGGDYSPIFDQNKSLIWCQALYDPDTKKLILRLEDGRTYRYPLALFSEHAVKKVEQNRVSAVFTRNGNLFPAQLVRNGATFYYNSLVHTSFYYFNYGKRYNIEEAQSFLENQGITLTKMGSLYFGKEE